MTQNLEEIRDSAELWKAIQATAGVDLSQVPILAKFLWFPTPQTGGIAPTVIEMGGEGDIPVKPGYIVFAMFQDQDEARVYALAKTAKDQYGKPNPPTRLALSKHAPLIGVEIMALDVFIDEIADELKASVGIDYQEEADALADAIREALEGDGVDLKTPPYPLLADALAAYEGEDEEEDEPEDEAPAPNGGVETVG